VNLQHQKIQIEPLTTCELAVPKKHITKHMAVNMVYKINKYYAQVLDRFNKARRSKILLFLPLWYLEN
jgi:hypothetical protein